MKHYVKDFLPLVKANKHTFHNLDAYAIADFKKEYEYLLKHKESEVSDVGVERFNSFIAKGNRKTEYYRKLRAMHQLSLNLVL